LPPPRGGIVSGSAGGRIAGKDGAAVLTAIHEVRSDVRCWFVGGTNGEYSRQQLLDRGAQGLLSKPLDRNSLRWIIYRAAESG
jgi:hypothetical protein